jgi:hypothetical protein
VSGTSLHSTGDKCDTSSQSPHTGDDRPKLGPVDVRRYSALPLQLTLPRGKALAALM